VPPPSNAVLLEFYSPKSQSDFTGGDQRKYVGSAKVPGTLPWPVIDVFAPFAWPKAYR
jgi:hypothetical protein